MLEITVKTLDSQNHSFSCDDEITVRGFKEHIAETVAVVADSQRLIYCGRVLQDDKKLSDYGNVNGKVIHLVQRPPPQPDTPRGSGGESSQQNNNQGWNHGGPRITVQRQYRGPLPRNAMYLGAMSMPAEVVESHGLPTPLSNTLSNSRLVAARRMLNKAMQLMDRLDDPSAPVHPSPTENNVSDAQPQGSVLEEESENDSNVNSNMSNAARNTMEQAASEIAAALAGAALINIRFSHDNDDGETVTNSINVIDPRQSESTSRDQTESDRPQTERTETQRPDSARPEQHRPGTERPEPEAATSSNENPDVNQRLIPQVPRPPLMAELLESLINTQDRLRPYIERYRALMSADPPVTQGLNGVEVVTENQRIVDGVSECLHYLAHANHALSDIIVDMGQQPPRNLRCRPIVIQHSAILQTGIPIQVESHINLTRTTTNNNNTTDEGNEATRPSSPTSGTSEQTNRSSSGNSRSTPQSSSGIPNQSSLLGTFLNLPSNVEVSMELSPSAMDLSSSSAADGSENEQAQGSNGNGGAGANANMIPTYNMIRNALHSILSGRHTQVETSNGGSTISASASIPFVTIVGQQMDIGTPNSGQSTQARSNIGTHPTTSTQTRSTARPHVLHPHSHPLNVGLGMGQAVEFDLFLPCNSHHIRRHQQPATTNVSSTQASQPSQSTSSESHSRSQSATRSSSARSAPRDQTINFTVGGDANVAREFLEGDGSAIASGLGLAMTLNELFQTPPNDVRISLIGSGPSASEIFLTPSNDMPLADLLRSFNVRTDEFTGRNFLIDLWLFLLRNVTVTGLMQMSMGQTGPLINLRRPLREFLEHSFPDCTREFLQEQVVEQIVSSNRPYLQVLDVPQEEASRQVDIPGTIEALIRKFCLEFMKLLFNNDLDNTTFAQEAITLAKKLEDQSSAVLQYILNGGQTALETIASRFINQLTDGIHPVFQQALLGVLSTRIRAYATRTSQMPQDEIASLLVYKEAPSAPPAEESEPVSEPRIKQESREPEQAQALPPQAQQPACPLKKKEEPEVKKEKPEIKPEPMETDTEKVIDHSMDLANGEEIPTTFPGAEHLPPEWVPIIARDSVRQRKQAQLEALQGGPLPFSDAYLSTMPSKRRKLVEQQKPQLLMPASPASGGSAIAASVERLVREGIGHAQIGEVPGAAQAVAAAPTVRTAFGQAIKDCLHPARLKTPDFPNVKRFPNASRLFAPGEQPAPESQQQQQQPDTSSSDSEAKTKAATSPAASK